MDVVVWRRLSDRSKRAAWSQTRSFPALTARAECRRKRSKPRRGDGVAQLTGRRAAPVGAEHRPEEAVVGMSAGVVAHRALLVLRQGREALEHLLDGLAVELRALQRAVGLVDVGLMVLVVMDAHRLLVDVRLERVVVVGKVGDLERHLPSLGIGDGGLLI